MSSRISLEKVGHAGFITFNNPSALNAFTADSLVEFRDALEECERSDNVSVVVLKGAGGKAFSAGADIRIFEGFRDRADAERFWRITALQTHTLIEKMTKPIVAAIAGYCLGGGLEIALCCDYVMATEDSKLGFPEINLGLIPGWGGTQRIARIVGRQKAKEMVMFGEMVDAKEAYRLGMVNKVVSRDELDREIQGVVSKLSEKSRTALAYAKDAVNTAYEVDLAAGLSREAELDLALIERDDSKQRIKAFLDRKKSS